MRASSSSLKIDRQTRKPNFRIFRFLQNFYHGFLLIFYFLRSSNCFLLYNGNFLGAIVSTLLNYTTLVTIWFVEIGILPIFLHFHIISTDLNYYYGFKLFYGFIYYGFGTFYGFELIFGFFTIFWNFSFQLL